MKTVGDSQAFFLSMFAGYCLVGLLGNPLAFALTWEGRDLSRYGLYKGAGLPLSPGVFNSYGFPLGGKQLAEGIPANTLMPILLVNIYTADELLDGAGHKVPGDHNISVFTYFPRLVYFYPFQPKDGRFRFYTDFILPASDQYVPGIMRGRSRHHLRAVCSGLRRAGDRDHSMERVLGACDHISFRPLRPRQAL